MSAPAGPARVVASSLGGVVEVQELGVSPYRVDGNGRPYVPTGDGGVVLGVRLGDGAFDAVADHAAPGACLVHPEQPARHALTSFSCLGNPVLVRSGPAAGARGAVLGKRGEAGRVIACFAPETLARLTPGDRVAVRGLGQGAVLPGLPLDTGVALMNVSPRALGLLRLDREGGGLRVPVRGTVPSHVIGNGIGRPVQQWDLDLQVTAASAGAAGLVGLRLGDLVAVTDLDVRHNAGYRRGWVTVGVIVHGGSPEPGHGPGLMPVLCGPARELTVSVQAADHRGITEGDLLAHDDLRSPDREQQHDGGAA